MMGAEEFLEVFRPERSRYVVRYQGRARPWTEYGYLSQALIEQHLRGDCMVAFFAGEGGRDYVGVDVDDHEKMGGDGGWVGGEGGEVRSTEKLRAKVIEVTRRMGTIPSAVFRTPHGAHCYWLFDREVQDELLGELMAPIVAGQAGEEDVVGEHRPTMRMALRVPNPKMFVGPTLEAVEFPGFKELARYNIVDVLGERVRPEAVAAWEREKSEKTRARAWTWEDPVESGVGAGLAGAEPRAGVTETGVDLGMKGQGHGLRRGPNRGGGGSAAER